MSKLNEIRKARAEVQAEAVAKSTLAPHPAFPPEPTLREIFAALSRKYNARFTIRATTYAVIFALGLALGKGAKPTPITCPVIPKSIANYSGDNHSAFNDDIGDSNRTK